MSTFYTQILEPFCETLKKFPSRNAFYIDGTYYTYMQFENRIAAIRSRIENIHTEEKVFALAIHDDIDTYASIFALWCEGKAYVPLHPNQPIERNRNIIKQVNAKYLIDSYGKRDFADDSIVVNTFEIVKFEPFSYELCESPDDDLAYILFTSGSTGTPKGVSISRLNLSSFIDSFWKTGISIKKEDRCMQLFDLTFDVSVQSFLVALINGACVYTVPNGHVKYLYAASLIQEQHVTFGAMAPSMLTYLRPYFPELDASSLKTCILTAEACPIDLIDSWFECAKNTEIYDFYGPTEATIYCSYYKLQRGGNNLSLNGIVSIGKPLNNVDAIIINEWGELVNGNEKGELCVAGDQVTPGYWNNDEKNRLSFFVKNGIRYYHTGDLCYMDNSGNIMYSGRIDQQAKIQGFRVELGEIEHYSRLFYNNEYRAVAIAFQNDIGLTEIALFIESNDVGSKRLLEEHLRAKMPPYMIPSRIIFEEKFPLNKSEKIDRNALKAKL